MSNHERGSGLLLSQSDLSSKPHLPGARDDLDDLDDLLEQVAAVLQLTDSQYRLAKEHYLAVTDWLSADGSPLAPYSPHLFPQGSMALLTTVRPWRGVEYDLDIVCQLLPTGWGAEKVYEGVYERLADHETYSPMLERMNRCVRLNYEHEFHLDIIPAEPEPGRGGTCIVIPDLVIEGSRRRWQWKSSNPRGYITWFHDRARTLEIFKERRVDPMPPRTTIAKNTVLATVVQLIKRYRDMQFQGSDLAPRSIILTTLAAQAYRGTQSTSAALKEVADGMAIAVRMAEPGRLEIRNPTNPDERFDDKFTGETYDAFRRFVFKLEAEVMALVSTGGGLPGLRPRLDEAFGEQPIQKALEEWGRRFAAAKEEGALRAGAISGITIANTSTDREAASRTTEGRRIPSHRFSGGT